ncbi:hypothetical protein J6590_013030 [Homalodisca vitripennis]|nr:hypothetical protein J6590_013030 [Homalodisca vitripennis]
MATRTEPSRKRDIDWNKFGLVNSHHSETENGQSGRYGTDGHQPTDANELFAGEQNANPWWKSQFFISQPVLFGTWDGVFTSCLINIFGVIVFLRSGWVVAQAGILNALLIVLSTVGVALISVLSAVGICERCRMESGGVYFLLAHVLGSRLGGAIGLLYVFGQAVGCSLFVLGLGESLAGLVGLGSSPWAQRGFASAAVLLLSIINLAGVKWVVKLQFALLLVLLLAGLDFAVGSFVHTDKHSGFQGWLSGNFEENLLPDYFDGYSWFTTLGVFFPTVTGVLAGINMSGDLRHPSTDIPNGTLAACATGTGLYLIFVLFLGATCTRQALKTDFMIAAKVSALPPFSILGSSKAHRELCWVCTEAEKLCSLVFDQKLLHKIRCSGALSCILVVCEGLLVTLIPRRGCSDALARRFKRWLDTFRTDLVWFRILHTSERDSSTALPIDIRSCSSDIRVPSTALESQLCWLVQKNSARRCYVIPA